MILDAQTVRDFESITRYPLSDFLLRFATFDRRYKASIYQYYSGSISKVPETSFNELHSLMEEGMKIFNMIDLHNNRLRSGLFWELIDFLTTIITGLDTVENSSKWLRSAITKNNYNPNPEVLYTMKRFQTLEKISGGLLGSTNPDKDWVQIALRNDLEEEEYSYLGGNSIFLATQGQYTLKMKTVVDNISEEKVYGLDLDRVITFDSEQDDLKALSYKETFKQTIDILSTLKQGMTPEFPNEGIQASLIQGTNVGSLPYPIIFRQLQSTFGQDDTIRSLVVTGIKTQDDGLFIDIDIESRFGEIKSTSINTSQL